MNIGGCCTGLRPQLNAEKLQKLLQLLRFLPARGTSDEMPGFEEVLEDVKKFLKGKKCSIRLSSRCSWRKFRLKVEGLGLVSQRFIYRVKFGMLVTSGFPYRGFNALELSSLKHFQVSL